VIGDGAADKVSAEHLRRWVYLYVRQSTLRQVVENTTSTDRQYALRSRAVALGWAPEQIVVIDDDLGRSGASAEGREGFQRLVADVGMGKPESTDPRGSGSLTIRERGPLTRENWGWTTPTSPARRAPSRCDHRTALTRST
jgi:Resolvase, N terminal domain